jgi:DNA-binding IclR family transcriptional regulator
MPLFHGATSKIILAYLPVRTLKSLFEQNVTEIARAGLGGSWEEFRSALAAIRRDGFIVTHGEIDAGRIGIGVPLFDREHVILGSLSFALSARRTDRSLIKRLAPITVAAARKIERLMNKEPAGQVSPARLRVSR